MTVTLKQRVLSLSEENQDLKRKLQVYEVLLSTQTYAFPQPIYKTQKDRLEIFVEGINYFVVGELKK